MENQNKSNSDFIKTVCRYDEIPNEWNFDNNTRWLVYPERGVGATKVALTTVKYAYIDIYNYVKKYFEDELKSIVKEYGDCHEALMEYIIAKYHFMIVSKIGIIAGEYTLTYNTFTHVINQVMIRNLVEPNIMQNITFFTTKHAKDVLLRHKASKCLDNFIYLRKPYPKEFDIRNLKFHRGDICRCIKAPKNTTALNDVFFITDIAIGAIIDGKEVYTEEFPYYVGSDNYIYKEDEIELLSDYTTRYTLMKALQSKQFNPKLESNWMDLYEDMLLE